MLITKASGGRKGPRYVEDLQPPGHHSDLGRWVMWSNLFTLLRHCFEYLEADNTNQRVFE